MKLSKQAASSIMMALQKGLVEQIDISNVILEFELQDTDDGLIVLNPPTFQMPQIEEENTPEILIPE